MSEKENQSEMKLLSEISSKIKEQESYLKKIDRAIFDAETNYLERTQNCGNIVKGWESFFSAKSTISGMGLPKKTKSTHNERVFSNSSYSNSHLTEDLKNTTNTSHYTDSSYISSPASKHPQKKKIMNSLSLKRRKLNYDTVKNLRDLVISSTGNVNEDEKLN